MLNSVQDHLDELLQPTAGLLPSNIRCETAIPELADERELLERAHGTPAHRGEALVELDGQRITLLHTYLRAGWRHAVADQWLRAQPLDRLRAAALALPDGFGFAVFDAWRPLALQQELFYVSDGATTSPDS